MSEAKGQDSNRANFLPDSTLIYVTRPTDAVHSRVDTNINNSRQTGVRGLGLLFDFWIDARYFRFQRRGKFKQEGSV